MQLTPNQKELYYSVTDYMRNNNVGPKKAFEALKLDSGRASYYYKVRALVKKQGEDVPVVRQKRTYNKRPKFETLVVPEAPPRYVVMMTVPFDQIGQTLRSILGGD